MHSLRYAVVSAAVCKWKRIHVFLEFENPSRRRSHLVDQLRHDTIVTILANANLWRLAIPAMR